MRTAREPVINSVAEQTIRFLALHDLEFSVLFPPQVSIFPSILLSFLTLGSLLVLKVSTVLFPHMAFYLPVSLVSHFLRTPLHPSHIFCHGWQPFWFHPVTGVNHMVLSYLLAIMIGHMGWSAGFTMCVCHFFFN